MDNVFKFDVYYNAQGDVKGLILFEIKIWMRI